MFSKYWYWHRYRFGKISSIGIGKGIGLRKIQGSRTGIGIDLKKFQVSVLVKVISVLLEI
jgi:hypothetical protein